jgi:hypothetical protein
MRDSIFSSMPSERSTITLADFLQPLLLWDPPLVLLVATKKKIYSFLLALLPCLLYNRKDLPSQALIQITIGSSKNQEIAIQGQKYYVRQWSFNAWASGWHHCYHRQVPRSCSHYPGPDGCQTCIGLSPFCVYRK